MFFENPHPWLRMQCHTTFFLGQLA